MLTTYHHFMIQAIAGLLVASGSTPVALAQAQLDQQSGSPAASRSEVVTKRQHRQSTRSTRPTPATRVPGEFPSERPRTGSTEPLSIESSKEAPRPLVRRGQSATADSSRDKTRGIWPVIGSLALVLGILAALVGISRRTGWTQSQTLPGHAIRILGGTPLDARHQLQLVRIGNRVVALAVSATSVESIAEIREPEEVAKIISLCNNGTGPAITELVDTDYSQPTPIRRGERRWNRASAPSEAAA